MGVTYVDIPPTQLFMSSSAGSGYETGPQYNGYAPTWTDDRAGAYVFSCTASAASPPGCTVHLGNGSVGFGLTVWYPVANESTPWANCAYVVSNASGQTPRSYAICIPVSSASFVMPLRPEPLT